MVNVELCRPDHETGISSSTEVAQAAEDGGLPGGLQNEQRVNERLHPVVVERMPHGQLASDQHALTVGDRIGREHLGESAAVHKVFRHGLGIAKLNPDCGLRKLRH